MTGNLHTKWPGQCRDDTCFVTLRLVGHGRWSEQPAVSCAIGRSDCNLKMHLAAKYADCRLVEEIFFGKHAPIGLAAI
jgi:hypothetical protein